MSAGGESAKDLGNAAYRAGDWPQAVGYFTTAHLTASSDPAPLLNRAQSYLKLQKWIDAARDCTSVLELPGLSSQVLIKAYYRRAIALKGNGQSVLAEKDLKQVLQLDPSNSAAKDELNAIGSVMKTPKSLPAGLPTRNRGVNVPVRIVPRFSPLVGLPSSAKTFVPLDPSPSFSNESSETPFASKQNDRKAKKSFAALPSDVATPSKPAARARKSIKAPTTYLDFSLRWGAVRDSRQNAERWELLCSLSPSELVKVIGPSMEPDDLASIFETLLLLKQHSRTDTIDFSEEIAIGYVQALRNMPRFEILYGLLSSEERSGAEELKNWLLSFS